MKLHMKKASPRLAPLPVRSWKWTPLMEERRDASAPMPDYDGRRAVDRAKEEREDDETGGPDA